MQKDGIKNEWWPIQWASKKLTPVEKRYRISERRMLAIFRRIKRFKYELRGRKFKLITDYKALEEIRRKPNYNNNRINRCIKKIQEFDFTVEYNPGDTMMVPDALSGQFENEQGMAADVKKYKRGLEIKEGTWKRRAIEKEGKQILRHGSGEKVEMPAEDLRVPIVQRIHENVNHRGVEAVHYRLKRK